MSDVATQLEDVIAREAIRDLSIRYCHYVRIRNVEGILDLYADDAVLDVPPVLIEGGVREGRAAMEHTVRIGLERLDPWPFAHNHVVDLQDRENATGVVYAEVRIGAEGHRVGHIVVYDDEYVLERRKWKFKSRKLTSTPLPGYAEEG